VTSTRFHIRVRKTWDSGLTAVGDAHHEDFVWYCPGHSVDKGGVSQGAEYYSGFNWGRAQIYSRFSGKADHLFGGNAYWGNTREFLQCDGDRAGSDGLVDWWYIPPYYH
jgi:hypothetical protein